MLLIDLISAFDSFLGALGVCLMVLSPSKHIETVNGGSLSQRGLEKNKKIKVPTRSSFGVVWECCLGGFGEVLGGV